MERTRPWVYSRDFSPGNYHEHFLFLPWPHMCLHCHGAITGKTRNKNKQECQKKEVHKRVRNVRSLYDAETSIVLQKIDVVFKEHWVKADY